MSSRDDLPNPWLAISGDLNVHPEDERYVRAWTNVCRDSHKKDSDQYVPRLDIPPVPFLGLHDAPVVVLVGNPGYVEDLDPVDYRRPGVRPAYARSRSTPGGTPFVALQAECSETDNFSWWQQRLREVYRLCDDDWDSVAQKVLAVQFHAYASMKFEPPNVTLPTQFFNFSLVERAMARGATIALMRGRNHWRTAVPGLADYGLLVEAASSRTCHVSPGNIKDGKFALIEEAVRLAG